VYIIHAALT